MIIQVFLNSMHGTFFDESVIFQVFHDFQSLWDPFYQWPEWEVLI